MAPKKTAPDYKALRKMAGTGGPGRPAMFPPEVAAARLAELKKRNSTAHSRTVTAIRILHAEDWHSLQEQALAEVNAERGPLPGDKS